MEHSKISIGLFVLRATIGGLLLFHGAYKLANGVDGIMTLLSSKGLPEFLAYGLYIGEFVAPLMLIAGFKTRVACMLIMFTMFMALVLVHAQDLFTLDEHGGWGVELLAMYFFGSLAIFLTGPGSISIENVRS